MTIASEKTSSALAQDTAKILDRLEEYALENPDETDYWIETELEAEQILLAMAAVIKQTIKITPTLTSHDKQMMRDVANKYRHAVKQGQARQLFRDMTEHDQLELRGMRLRVREIVIN